MVETYTERRMDVDLDLAVYCLPKPLSEFLHEASSIKDSSSKLSEIRGFVDRLEEERRKIDAFKRELPLSMLLLNEAIGRLKDEATRFAETRHGTAAIEGFVASNRKLKEDRGTKGENDKKNWMSSAQLWISSSDTQLQSAVQEEEEERGEDQWVSHKQGPNSNLCNKGGAFVPFIRPSGNHHHHVPPPHLPLNLMSPASDMVVNFRVDRHQPSKSLTPTQKKEQRRRWSPELHRKFIDALQQLGGSQVATPKQIRELMQVEGLTNDEVKSHLQKYRIHIRKHAICSSGETAITDCKNKESESQMSFSQSDSPQGPLARRGFSGNGDQSSEGLEDYDDDEKSDGQSCKNSSNRKQAVDLQL